MKRCKQAGSPAERVAYRLSGHAGEQVSRSGNLGRCLPVHLSSQMPFEYAARVLEVRGLA